MSVVDDVIIILERLHKNITSLDQINASEKQHLQDMIDLAVAKLAEAKDDNTKKNN